MNTHLAPAHSAVVDDVALLEDAIPGMLITQLDRERNGTEMTVAEIGTTGLCVGSFGFKVSSEAGFGGDEFRLGLQLDEGVGSWNGEDFGLDKLWVYGPGSEHSGAATPGDDGRGTTWATLTVPRTTMTRMVGPDVVDRRPGPAIVGENLGLLRMHLEDVVHEVVNGSFTVEHARRVERDLLHVVSAVMAGPRLHRSTARSAYRITRECIAVADELDPIPTTIELATALDISDRWVRAAFTSAYGVSVTEFFRSRSLHRARRALIDADPTTVSVTDIAMECGFWHLGRFSGYYRSHFGELPRQTLQRRA